ncbi:hypothetical protein HDV05_005222 [Chytridiales sp. JEL 0842]|nr:hypothetical protein HDV05_005222 [Chytridiales sp. JEL 0842]
MPTPPPLPPAPALPNARLGSSNSMSNHSNSSNAAPANRILGGAQFTINSSSVSLSSSRSQSQKSQMTAGDTSTGAVAVPAEARVAQPNTTQAPQSAFAQQQEQRQQGYPYHRHPFHQDLEDELDEEQDQVGDFPPMATTLHHTHPAPSHAGGPLGGINAVHPASSRATFSMNDQYFDDETSDMESLNSEQTEEYTSIRRLKRTPSKTSIGSTVNTEGRPVSTRAPSFVSLDDQIEAIDAAPRTGDYSHIPIPPIPSDGEVVGGAGGVGAEVKEEERSFWEDFGDFLRYWGIIAPMEDKEKGRLNYITGLRALACLAVFNMYGKDFNTAKGMEMFGTGWLAVPLFFLISGRLNGIRLTKSFDMATLKSVFVRRIIRLSWILCGASLLFWYMSSLELFGIVDTMTRRINFQPISNVTAAYQISEGINAFTGEKVNLNGTDPVSGVGSLQLARFPSFWMAFKQPINQLARALPMFYPGPNGYSSGFWTMTIDLRNCFFLYFMIIITHYYPGFKWPIMWSLLISFYLFQTWTGIFLAGFMINEFKPTLSKANENLKRVLSVLLFGVLIALFFVSDKTFDKYNNYILVDTYTGDFHPKYEIPFQTFQYRGFWGALCVLFITEMSTFVQGLLTVRPLMFIGKVSVGVYIMGPLVLASFRNWLAKLIMPNVYNALLIGQKIRAPFVEGWLTYLLALLVTLIFAYIFHVSFDRHSTRIAEWTEWIMDGGDEPEREPPELVLEKGHSVYLNGLRGFASIGVFVRHSGALLRGPSLSFFNQNAFSVPLFFVLSGRVVGLQIAKRKDIKTIAGNVLRRPLRLCLPIMYAQVAYWVLVTYTKVFDYSLEASRRIDGYYPFASNKPDDVKLSFVGAITQPITLYMNGTAPQYPINMHWTLVHELINAYAIFLCAAIAVLYKSRQWAILLPVCIVAYLFQVWLAAFMMGFFMSQYMYYMKKWNIIYRHIFAAVCIVLIVLNTAAGDDPWNRANNQITVNQDGGMGYILDKYPLFFQFDPRGIWNAFLLVHVIELMELCQWFFTRKPVLFLGRVSYGVYLVHPIILASFRSWLFCVLTPADRDPRDVVLPFATAMQVFFGSLAVTIVGAYCLHKTADVQSLLFAKWLERVMLGEKDAIDFTLKKERVKMYNWLFDPFSIKKKAKKEVEKWKKVKKASAAGKAWIVRFWNKRVLRRDDDEEENVEEARSGAPAMVQQESSSTLVQAPEAAVVREPKPDIV